MNHERIKYYHDHYATVDEMIAKLKALSDRGKGDYVVDCNEEYWLAKKSDAGKVFDDTKTVTFGGYFDA